MFYGWNGVKDQLGTMPWTCDGLNEQDQWSKWCICGAWVVGIERETKRWEKKEVLAYFVRKMTSFHII